MVASDLILIDTNVLVDSFDSADHTKQRVAIDILDEIVQREAGVVSVQRLTELFNAITRNIVQPVAPQQAVEHVEDVASTFTVIALTHEAVIRACHAVAVSQISTWDALIWSVARLNGISTIRTEDMQHRSSIDGVRYENPFADDFNLSALLIPDRP